MQTKGIYWFGGWIFDFTKIITIILFAILIIHFFVATIIIVSGPSMKDTHNDGDVLIVEKASYWFFNPKRGDVVGINFPSAGSRRMIKRVVGLPGEKISTNNGTVMIDDQELAEDYVKLFSKNMNHQTVQLKDDEYFVMGDNRDNSLDSRNYGPLPKSAFVGKKLFFWMNFKNIFNKK